MISLNELIILMNLVKMSQQGGSLLRLAPPGEPARRPPLRAAARAQLHRGGGTGRGAARQSRLRARLPRAQAPERPYRRHARPPAPERGVRP